VEDDEEDMMQRYFLLSYDEDGVSVQVYDSIAEVECDMRKEMEDEGLTEVPWRFVEPKVKSGQWIDWYQVEGNDRILIRGEVLVPKPKKVVAALEFPEN